MSGVYCYALPMTNTGIVMVPVVDILRDVEASVDFGFVTDYLAPGVSTYDYDDDELDEARTRFWKSVISSKASDTGFHSLIDAVLEDGWHPASAIGWTNGRITEGHHRLVLAILLGMDEVPTTTWGSAAVNDVCAHYSDDPDGGLEIPWH